MGRAPCGWRGLLGRESIIRPARGARKGAAKKPPPPWPVSRAILISFVEGSSGPLLIVRCPTGPDPEVWHGFQLAGDSPCPDHQLVTRRRQGERRRDPFSDEGGGG